MSAVTSCQVSFNGGEISRRLRARIDQGLYAISCEEMVGFAPLVEGAAEAIPGLIHVAQALGECRLTRFEYSSTQGHVLEWSNAKVRVFTNDALVATVNSPFSLTQAKAMRTHQSYDVLYCFHGDLAPREFQRNSATSFSFVTMTLDKGPFDSPNTDKSKLMTATSSDATTQIDGPSGSFSSSMVGALIRLEAKDFGAIRAWEPYITVTDGQVLTANERVYQVIDGNGETWRTGSLMPIHIDGAEWDGIAQGLDINEKDAAGVKLQFICDRFGVARITSYVNSSRVIATVLRRLPEGINTWRWSIGAFGAHNGYPQCGVVWNDRMCLALGSTIYCSVVGDYNDFSDYNEFGEVSDDMGFTITLDDPNPIQHLVAADRLLALTAKGCYAISQASAAAGVGPGNVKAELQHSVGAGAPIPAVVDSRTLFIDRSQRRIYDADLDLNRNVEQPYDLTRYCRHIGTNKFVSLASQQHPFNHVWAVTGDGKLACGAYLPEEDVLGFVPRPLAPGMTAISCTSITDPNGEFDQLWVAALYGGNYHVLRLSPFRQDGESDLNAVMLDMAASYDGTPTTTLTHPQLKSKTIEVVYDGKWATVVTNSSGGFTIPEAASKVNAGLAYPAYVQSLPIEMGGDNGPAMGKLARYGRAWVRMLQARGWRFGVAGDMRDIEELEGDGAPPDDAIAPVTGYRFREAVGSHTRTPHLRIERVAPFQGTLLAWGGDLDMEGL